MPKTKQIYAHFKKDLDTNLKMYHLSQPVGKLKIVKNSDYYDKGETVRRISIHRPAGSHVSIYPTDVNGYCLRRLGMFDRNLTDAEVFEELGVLLI